MRSIKLVMMGALLVSGIAKADPKAKHGMLLFGKDVTYASHLPMFHAPHDYQVILKLELSGLLKSDAIKDYEEAKEAGSTLFTIDPEPMDLTKVIDGSITSFKADIYDGHFERGGKNLGPALVNVAKVVFAKKLVAESDIPSPQSYLLFGDSGEYFAAHVIGTKPNFDTIVETSQPQKISHSFCGRRNCDSPLVTPVADAQLPLEVFSNNPAPAEQDILGLLFVGVHAVVQKALYFEENELSH